MTKVDECVQQESTKVFLILANFQTYRDPVMEIKNPNHNRQSECQTGQNCCTLDRDRIMFSALQKAPSLHFTPLERLST